MARRRHSRRPANAPPPAHDPPRRSPPAWPWLLAGLGVAAGSLRLIHAGALAGSPVFAVLIGDSKRYVEWAAEIASGNWLGSGAFYQAPLYPYLLGALFSLFGESLDAIRAAQALAGGLACVLVAVAGRSFFDWRAGLAAGALIAVYPPAIFFDGHIQKSSLDLLLMALLVALAGRYQLDAKNRTLVLLGVALGLLTLSRENARVLYPVLVAWLFFRQRGVPAARRLRPVIVFSLAALAAIAPVIGRNYAVSGEGLISTSQLGSNFYIGNRRGATGVYEPLVPDRGTVLYEQADAVRLASAAAGRPLAPGEVSRYWLGRALEDIRADPAGWARLLGRKLLLAVNVVEATDTESLEFHAARSAVLRALSSITFGVVLPLAVAGIALTAADWRRLAVLYGIGLVFLGSVALFFVLARYRYPVVPVVMLFAGAAVAGAGDAWRRHPRRLIAAALLAVITAIVVNTPMRVTADESAANFGAELLRLERPGEAIPLLQEAVALAPDDVRVRRDLGLAFLKAGDAVAAAREYAVVARLDPGDPANHRELAVAAEAAGDRTTALNSLREAARLEPASVATLIKLGDLLGRLEQTDEGRRVYERALLLEHATPQESVGAQVRLAAMLANDGRLAEALQRLEQAGAAARASGQTAVAADIDATIRVVRERLGRSK